MDLLHGGAGHRGHVVEGRVQRVGVRRELGHHGGRGVEPGGHRRAQVAHLGAGALRGREVLGQHPVHVGQRLAQPGRLAGEVAAHLVGVQVRLGEQVADAGEREVPPVARGAQELLEHGELERLGTRAAGDLQPAVEGGDVVGAGPGEHLVDGDVRVDPRGDLAEDLEQGVLAEHHRGVGLLAAEQRRVGVQVELVPGQPVEHQLALGDRTAVGDPGRERPEQVRHRVAVVDGVVDEGVTVVGHVHLGDQRVVEPVLRVGVDGQRELVELHVARVGVGELDEVDQHRRTSADRTHPADVGDLERAALAAEPPRVAR